jgi:hypothetical protein
MENKYFLVVSALKHNDTLHRVGTVIEGSLGDFETLVIDGVLKLIEGAKNLAHAEKIVAANAVASIEADVAEVKPVNTWGAQPDPVPAEAGAGAADPVPQATDTKPAADPVTNVPAGDNL